MRHELNPRSRSPPNEQEVDAEVGMLLAAQLRELLRGQSLDTYTHRILPGILRILRLGATKSALLSAAFGTSAGEPISSFPQLLEASWSSVLVKEMNTGVRIDAFASFLDSLLLAQTEGSPETSSEAFFERFKPKSSQGLCGYLFQRNDIAFNCRTCQLDETCVLCLKCYQNGNHEGHDVTFHRTAPGGMCDCGDAEAWDPNGFCIYHGNHDQDADAIPLPAGVTQVAHVLFEEVVNFFVYMAKASIESFDPDKVDRNGRVLLEQYRVLNEAEVALGAHPSSPTHQRRASAIASWSPKFHVRICNDDVHSDEDLVSSLLKKNIREARRLVRGIDSNGSELVSSNLALRDALALMQQLKTEGWHVCVVHDQHIRDENILNKVIQWVKTVCQASRPLHKMFCEKLFATNNVVSSPKEPIQVLFLSDPYFRKDIVTVLYELYLKLQGDKEPKLQFSLVFLKVYNRLMVKYLCGIGTKDETLFGYGVQIFTTPSIVTRLASLGLVDVILETLSTALDLAKTSTLTGAASLAARSSSSSSSPSALSLPTRTLDCDHSILKFKRYLFVVDHLGYVMNIPSVTSDLYLSRDHLRKWLTSLRQMQGFDPQVRIQDGHAHVTYETQLWFSAFNFHSYVSRLMTIVCKGLRQHEGDAIDKSTMVRNVMEGFWEQLEFGGMTDPNLSTHNPTFGFGVGSAFSESIVKYDVASQPVSFHYPLHGFLANFLLENLYYGTEVKDWKSFIEESLVYVDSTTGTSAASHEDDDAKRRRKKMLVYGMVEFPLRTLVLCAQIQSGLWIRNGQSMHRQMLHYTNPPLCAELRDLDLLLVQVGACVVGFTKFLGIYFDRFGLMEWLQTWNTSDHDSYREATFTMGDEKLVSLLEGALLHLIWLITELPPPMKEIEERDVWLKREIVHRLSQQPCRLSELLDQTGFMTATPFGGVSSPQGNEHLARLENILEEVAEVQMRAGQQPAGNVENGDAGALEPIKYVLKKEFYREYDPAFYHLARSAHEKAQFARQEALFKFWKVEDEPIPLVQHLPPVHSSFSSMRLLVCEKGLLGILRLVLEDANSDASVKKTTVMVILRTIHLINLVVLVLRNEKDIYGARLVDTKKRRVLALLRSGPETFEESEWSTTRGKKRFKRQTDDSSDGDVQMSSDSDQGDVSEVEELSIVALLVTFAQEQVKHDFDMSKSTISAIYWILKELAAIDSTINVYVQENVWKGVKKTTDEQNVDNGLSKAQLQKLHQQRAIEAMLAKQKAFAQSSLFADMEEFDEDDEDDIAGDGRGGAADEEGVISGSTIVYRPPPPPECIICTQKKKREPVMYIGHAQTSQVNVHALQEKPFPAAPLSDAFPPPMYLSLCGHAVHLQCWKKYFDSVKAQSRFNLEHSQSNIAFDAHFGEFLCPLCQSLSSMLVPHVPPSKSLTYDEQQRDRDAMERVFQAKQDTRSILAWLSDGLPSRLEALETEGENDAEMDMEDDGGTDEDETDRSSKGASPNRNSNPVEDDIRAMKQFAVSFLEALSRFQPEMTHLTATIATLKKSFFSTGPQLTHLMWSAVASTCTSVQLSGISAAIFALESANSPSEKFLARRRMPRNSPLNRQSSESSPSATSTASSSPAAPAPSFSSLRITSLLNPPLPSLKNRLAVSLPESFEGVFDSFSPKDDDKLNCLLRSLRRVFVLFKNRKQDFYRTMVLPIHRNLRLNLGVDEWMASLARGAPLQLGQPILGQDLFYLCVAVCSSMVHTKAEIVMTIRSICVLHMAQVLLQIARMNAEEPEDDENEEDDAEAEENMDEDAEVRRERLTPRERESAKQLTVFMERLSAKAGVDIVARDERDGAPYYPPRGSLLLYLFKSSCLAFMREATLLCRGFFRGEHDPDASNYANFVSSLRLSTNFHDMCQQLGMPSIDQILVDEALMSYLDQAAAQLRTSRFACVPDEIQYEYKQHGNVDGVLQSIDELSMLPADSYELSEAEEFNVILRNLNQLPALPIRLIEDSSNTRQFYFANVRLVRLQPLYTDLHSEVLAHSRCPTTDKLVENPAICLVCEQVLCAGTDCCRRQSDGMGACTTHAISCGYGVGLFFLMRSSSVLLVFGPRSSYFGSPYLDMFGEEDINLRRGRPLYLNSKRMRALLRLYANHQVANEVARNRRTSDQYIRNNYY